MSLFISYRRNGGELLAKTLHDRLTYLGYKVFYDIETLNSGNFNEKIYKAIDACDDFIIILSPGALDRCSEPDDWVTKEIAYALLKNKNIIPIIFQNFEFPQILPNSINLLRYQNGLFYDIKFFDKFIERLVKKYLTSKRAFSKPALLVLLSICFTIVLVSSIILFVLLNQNIEKPGIVKKIEPENMYTLHYEKNQKKPIEQFNDGICNYFYYKIGEIHSVPIFYSETYEHIGTNQFISNNSLDTLKKMLEETNTFCFSNYVSSTALSSFQPVIDSECSTLSIAGAKMSDKFSFNNAINQSVVEPLLQSSINKTFASITLDENNANGYYRYISFANYDIFIVLISNLETEEVSYQYLTSIQEGSISSNWYYSKNKSDIELYSHSSFDKKLSFSAPINNKILFTELNEKRLIRKIIFSDNPNQKILASNEDVCLSNFNIASMLNSKAISELELDQATITLNYTTEKKSGVANSITSICTKKNNQIETLFFDTKEAKSQKTNTVQYTVSIENLREQCLEDKKLYIYFAADKNYPLDLFNNNYWVLDIELIVEFEKNYNN